MSIETPQDLVVALRGRTSPKSVRMVADMVRAQDVASKRDVLNMVGVNSSPFFIPADDGSTLSPAQWLSVIGRARMAAAENNGRRVLVAAPMKTGSTFIARALGEGCGLPRRGLSMLTGQAYDFVQYGAGMQAFRVDELALVTNCLAGRFLAHHHVVCSPHLAGLLEIYSIKPVLIRRNVFDCLVSLDEFYRKDTAAGPRSADSLYFNNGMPFHWQQMDDDERMAAILDRYLQFYIDFYVSWARCEAAGFTQPLWISYEQDILGDKELLARRLGDYLGLAADESSSLVAALTSDKKMDAVHFNKGVAGRGAAITGRNRERILTAFERYKDYADWSDIVGE